MFIETEGHKFLEIILPYLQGDGIDIGSAGHPIVPSAIQVDLPEPYSDLGDLGTVNLHGTARDLKWFQDESLDYVYSSHVLEDFSDWSVLIEEWCRVVKSGGYLIVLVPDRERFRKAIEGGQSDNPNHQHEFTVGELSAFLSAKGDWEIIFEEMPNPENYTIVFVARRKS